MMLRDFLRKLRRAKQKRYIRTLERQLDEMIRDRKPPATIEQKRAAIRRARSRLASMLLPLVLIACSHPLAQESLEVAAIVAQEVRLACEKGLANLDGDTSTAAVQARRDCLKMPQMEGAADAADAVAYEVEAARHWVTAGN
ncbi:MAG: hypothetical protein KAI80_05910 [Hyphomicrobiaceae bacterium]|nr:hypothetical protein [Hyphomicrobiaceae bacterium]